MARTLELIKARHGDRMADAPQTRELITQMIDSGIHDAAAMVSIVELSGGKRYDPATATFLVGRLAKASGGAVGWAAVEKRTDAPARMIPRMFNIEQSEKG